MNDRKTGSRNLGRRGLRPRFRLFSQSFNLALYSVTGHKAERNASLSAVIVVSSLERRR